MLVNNNQSQNQNETRQRQKKKKRKTKTNQKKRQKKEKSNTNTPAHTPIQMKTQGQTGRGATCCQGTGENMLSLLHIIYYTLKERSLRDTWKKSSIYPL